MFKEILTSPQNHNPNNFLYVTHGISDGFTMHSKKGIHPSLIEQKIKRIKSRRFFYCGTLIGKLEQETAKKLFNQYRINLPISQIDTYGEVGLILNIANDDVIYTASTSDLFSPKKQEDLKEFAIRHKGKIEQPLKLLLMSEGMEFGSNRHNEMILRGHPATNISGVFYQDANSKTENEGKLLGEMVSQLEKREITVISLPQPVWRALIEMKGDKSLEDTMKFLSEKGVIKLLN